MVDAPGAYVFGLAWVVALVVTVALRARGRALLPALLLGPILGVSLIGLVAQGEDTITRQDAAALMGFCVVAVSVAVVPIAYLRWLRRLFRDAERRIRLQ
jgi:hypothetical protein